MTYLVRPWWTDPDDFRDDSEISGRKYPAFDAQLVVEVADDFGVLEKIYG